MSERIANIKRLVEVTISAVAGTRADGRYRSRGKDFMRDDLTYGADRAEL